MIRTHDVAATVEVVRIAELMKRKVSFKSVGKMEAEIVAEAGFRDDMEDAVKCLGSKYTEALSQKAVFRVIKVKNVPTPLALIAKQGMLSAGGDAALPKSASVSSVKVVDILLMGTLVQYGKALKKVEKAPFDGWKLAKVLQDLLKLDEDYAEQGLLG